MANEAFIRKQSQVDGIVFLSNCLSFHILFASSSETAKRNLLSAEHDPPSTSVLACASMSPPLKTIPLSALHEQSGILLPTALPVAERSWAVSRIQRRAPAGLERFP